MDDGEGRVTDQDGAGADDRCGVVVDGVADDPATAARLSDLDGDPGDGGGTGPVAGAEVRGDVEVALEKLAVCGGDAA